VHRHRRPQELTPLHLLGAAAGTYRRRPWRVAGSALVVFAPVAAAQYLSEGLAESLAEEWVGSPLATALVVLIAALSAQVLMIEFYAGLLDRVVGEDQYGHETYSFGRVLRTLPWLRLALASLVIGAVTNLGLALAIVPGVVAFTYLSLAGPVINIEGRGVWAGLRRSVTLVRGRFWLTATCVTLPLVVEELAYEFMHHFAWAESLLGAILVEEFLAVTVIAFVGLAEVTLAHALVSGDHDESEPAHEDEAAATMAPAQGDDAGAPNPSP
jgi:hypothetical protein